MRLRPHHAVFALALGAGSVSGVAHADAPAPITIAFEKYTLDNGLEVVLHEDHRTPVIAVNVWYHVGSKDEPKGKNGFAHLFEHVMFQGSKHVGEDMFFRYLERAGASDRNGTTNLDRTNYFETVPSNQLAVALWLEGDRMGTLLEHANDATFKSQREVVKNERRQNYENAPYGLVRQFVRAALFPETHPYHLLTIGTPEDLDSASIEDVRTFFRTFYVPNNATLVIAGDLDPARVKELVSRYFGGIPKGATPSIAKSPMPVTLTAEKRLDVEADVELGRVQIDWPTPAQYQAGDADLDLLARVLASGKSSRLYKRLVYDLQMAQSVSVAQESSQLAGVFDVTVTLRKGKDPKAALKIVDEEIDKLRTAPPSADELERARTGLLTHLTFDTEKIGAKANALNEYNQVAGDPGFLTKDIARYAAVTAADVTKAVAMLPKSARVVTIVTPDKTAPRAGRLREPVAPGTAKPVVTAKGAK